MTDIDLRNEVPELGDLVRDEVTHAEGIVVVYAKHLTGCDRVTIQPRVKEGQRELPAAYSHDITTVTVLEKQAVKPRTFAQEPRSQRPGGSATPATTAAF